MEYTELLKLIKKTPTKDSIGQITYTETISEVYAKKNAVGTKEFYSAVGVGITPTAELQIRLSNYNDETEAEYKGQKYAVIRTVPKGKFDIVLVLGVKTSANN